MNDALFSVVDQVVWVVGASRGIGRALAQGFAQRGARVVISGREQGTLDQAAREIAVDGSKVLALACDIADPEACASTCRLVTDRLGRIDTLVNVAGINHRKRVEDYALAEFDAILHTNLRSVFALSQCVGRHMIEQRRGSIINIDSLNTYAPLPGVAPYAISKAGVLMMTRAMATEWGPHGIRVNSIAPGFFPTALTAKVWQQPKLHDWAISQTPLGRLGEVGDLVGAAIFLASDAARFVTGQTLRVDGGITAGLRWPFEMT